MVLDILKTFGKSLGMCLIIILGAALLLALAVGPIIGTIFLANYIGYWWIVLLIISIAWAVACIITIVRVILAYNDEKK
jgi:O-antigen/teichoic acid export membrane protein